MSLWLRRGRGPERRAAERRELEERRRQQWESTSRAFARAAACCSLQARWSEPRVPRPRYGRGPAGSRGGAGLPLTRRRERLERLLGEEREALAAELRERRRGGMRSRELRDGPGECGKFAEPLLHEHWNKNNAELREAESELHRKHVREAWGDQLTQQNKEEVTRVEEKKHYENEYETARGEALERTRQEEEKHQLEKQQAETLLQQIEELKLQETKATKLKKEQENLLKQQWELKNLEEERKQMEEHRRKKELGRFLRHQCDVQLRRRAQQIQEELETDRQILSALLEKEDEDQHWQIARRERAVADVAWMKKVIEEQLQLEKEREAELETIFREEAKKIWEKREEEWEREKVARDRLMSEVLAGRQRQIQEKMKLNRRAQEESIKYREQLIRELEEAKEGTRQEKEQEEEQQRAHRRELQAQGTEHSLREEEEQQEESAQQPLEEVERQEGKQGWHSRFYSSPRAAWT
ncbi:PREDICTED: trichoplein keratin filament-binding protein [Pseudopodoces humilis]|uniref:trichoplein keratin filament-binding protein n=1 Tax=Pseudopodoces humilis TaxID=181119 RepID=UPI0006B7783F|nr:PREDICTED: trichoplein keratin filament-binding protein [Pseudopodoces humilis]